MGSLCDKAACELVVDCVIKFNDLIFLIFIILFVIFFLLNHGILLDLTSYNLAIAAFMTSRLNTASL